jgi:hypothetical protein
VSRDPLPCTCLTIVRVVSAFMPTPFTRQHVFKTLVRWLRIQHFPSPLSRPMRHSALCMIRLSRASGVSHWRVPFLLAALFHILPSRAAHCHLLANVILQCTDTVIDCVRSPADANPCRSPKLQLPLLEWQFLAFWLLQASAASRATLTLEVHCATCEHSRAH